MSTASLPRTVGVETRSAKRPAAWLILLIFCTTVVLFVGIVAEVALRIGELRVSAAADPRCAGSDATQLTQKGLFTVDATAGYVMRPNLCAHLRTSEYDQILRTNNRGLVGPEVPSNKPLGEFRIVVLGDSYTVGGQVAYEQTFPAILEEQLHKRGYVHTRVINAGVGGYTTYNEAGLLREDLSWLQPDLIVVATFVGNDVAENILATVAGYVDDPEHPKGFSFGSAASELVQRSLVWFPRNGQTGDLAPLWNPGDPLPHRAPTPAPATSRAVDGSIPAWVVDASPMNTFKNTGHWLWDTGRAESLVLSHLFGQPPNNELLRVFAINPDRVLTHRTLLVSVLGPGYEDALDNLRTFVATLRRKVEREPDRPQRIITEPSLGYRFRSEAVPTRPIADHRPR